MTHHEQDAFGEILTWMWRRPRFVLIYILICAITFTLIYGF